MTGNPLTCDCETLWLRNWASETPASSIRDEPRCYFPKSLSGNPLRRLRTSRFTCDDEDGGRRGDSSRRRRRRKGLIGDACAGVPLKTPPQAVAIEAASDNSQLDQSELGNRVTRFR